MDAENWDMKLLGVREDDGTGPRSTEADYRLRPAPRGTDGVHSITLPPTGLAWI